MSKYTKEDIFRIVEEEDVAFIRLQFCDIFGTPKNIAITTRQLDKALNNEIMFDGASVEGFVRSEESDMYLYPDIDTFDIFPWRPQSGKVARMFCNVHTLDGKPYAADPRNILKRVLENADEMGLKFKIDPHLEFFLFDTDDAGRPTTETHESAGYFDVAPADQAENVRRDIIMNLEDMNFDISSSHHESAPGQHEIDFAEDLADRMADMIMTFRITVKTIAKRHGLYATFMPKPKEGVSGSGMHMNILCENEEGESLFSDDYGNLTDIAYQFIAGVLEHIKGITLVTNPLVNSYKRLVPGYEAPVNISWSSSSANRSSLIRIPSQRGAWTRLELRNPDGTCNPYLAIALILAAGMDGIKKGLVPPAEMHENFTGATNSDIRNAAYENLPQTLGEAIEAYQKDELVKEVLGDSVFEKYLDAKRCDWDSFRTCVTQWEIAQYLNKY